MNVKLIFIRHGQTNWTKNKKMQGHIEIPLSRKGRKQIKKLANKLKKQGEKPDLIISSPLKRARQSAAIIASNFKILTTIDENLTEKDLGDLTGKTWKEVNKKYEFVSQTTDKRLGYDYSPYNGESIDDIKSRIEKFLNNIKEKYNHYNTIIVVTHAGILRILFSEIFHDQLEGLSVKINPACCYICSYNFKQTKSGK